MMLFNGDHKNTKIIGPVNGKFFYWKLDTGSAVTCMNINAFETAFRKKKEDKQTEFRIDIFIKKRRCSHTVQISNELSENILGIDFLQKFWLHLDPKTQQITFLPTPSKALFATKKFTLPPFATALIQAISFKMIDDKLNYIADIGVPKQPLISGPSTWVSFDHRKQFTLQIQNCALHEVSIKARDILGKLDMEKDTPIPFSNESLATICEQIHQRLPKVKKRTWTRKEIKERCHLGAPEPYQSQYIDILVKHQLAISLDKHDLGVVRQSNSSYNSPIFCVPKNKAKDSRLFKTSANSTSTPTSTSTP
jgi:hypothetical protein